MSRTRKEQYEEKRDELLKICEKCRKNTKTPPSIDRCNYHCSTGTRLRMLEAEYKDVTGWGHDSWKT